MQGERWQKLRTWLIEEPSLQRWWQCVELVEGESQETDRQLLRDYLLSHTTKNNIWSSVRYPCGDWAPDFSGWDLCHIPSQSLSHLPGATEIYCPPGHFRMGVESGRGLSQACPPMNVTLTRGFWVLSTPVTQEMYESVMGENPSDEQGEFTQRHPVEFVNWEDATSFCNQLSEIAGLEPVYELRDEKTHWNRDADGYRLLTEAEWEYACRAGSTKAQPAEVEEVAWFDENSNEVPHPVAQKQPNAWGLFDTLGNVLEWCFDSADERRPEADEHIDPVLDTSGRLRLCRGGAWSYERFATHAAYCEEFYKNATHGDLGFRIGRNG